MAEKSQRFELPITVGPEHIDELGHVNNVIYVQWVQDAAVAHWTEAAHPDDRAALVWVVTRHEIDYRRPAFEGDEIVIRTWIGTARRLAFDRHTEIVRVTDGKVLATARTVWCPIDPATGRPTDVSDRVRERFSVGPE